MNNIARFKKLPDHSLFVHEIIHGVAAIPFAIYSWRISNSVLLALAVIITTYLIDLDHLIDYFSYYGLEINLSKFLKGKYFDKKRVALIPFHAWEWLVILFLLHSLGAYDYNSFYFVITLALIPHYIFDSLCVGSFAFYSIIFRYTQSTLNSKY